MTLNEFRNLFDDTVRKLPIETFCEYCSAPAAAKHHQNYLGGLVEHSYKLALELFKRTAEGGATHHIIGLTSEECAAIGAFHDLCKVFLYIPYGNGEYMVNKDLYPHHGVMSVARCEENGIKLNQTERVCILLHMAGAWWNQEDADALTESDKEWLVNHFDIVSAVQWADMKACE